MPQSTSSTVPGSVTGSGNTQADTVGPAGGPVAATSSDAWARTRVESAPSGAGLRDFISARDAPFGASFGGVSDDSAALNAAQRGTSTLWLPNGTAVVNGAPVLLSRSSQKIRGQGMYSTVLRGTSASLTSILRQLPSGWVSQVEIEDMTLDGAGLVGQGVAAYGSSVGHLAIRRCRFVNFPAGIIDAGYAKNFIIEDCVADGAGTGLGSFFTATNKPAESVIIRRNRLRWLSNGILIGSNNFHAAWAEISDNDIDLGWWLLRPAFAGPAGTVTYTSTGLADTGASFSGIGANQTVRAMPVRQSGTLTSATRGTYAADTAGNFITAGVRPGEIIRSGTSFAVVSAVISATALHVEEWLDQVTYQPVVPPASGASYTAYGIILGSISSSTATTLTVAHGSGGGGGGWYDLAGTETTPAAGTLYEVLVTHPVYPLYVTSVTEKLIVSRNRVRRGWADNMELFGSRMIVTGNIVEDGQDEGIALQGPSTSAPSGTSIVSGNILRHNATSGLTLISEADCEVGPNQYQDNGWGVPAGNLTAQLTISNSVRVTVAGGRAASAGMSTPQAGLKLDGASTAGCKVAGFSGAGAATADIYVTSTVPAGANSILDCTGVIGYQGTGNGQLTRGSGTGAPSVPASPGSTWTSTGGGTGTTLYVKEAAADNTGWDAVGSGAGYGRRVAYSAITTGVSVTGATSLTTMTALPGAPSITLPAGGIFRVTLNASFMQVSSQQFLAIGIGTGASAILKYCYSGTSGETSAPCVIETDVTGTGQVITCYAYASSAGTVTLGAAANAPAELSAVLVG